MSPMRPSRQRRGGRGASLDGGGSPPGSMEELEARHAGMSRDPAPNRGNGTRGRGRVLGGEAMMWTEKRNERENVARTKPFSRWSMLQRPPTTSKCRGLRPRFGAAPKNCVDGAWNGDSTKPAFSTRIII